MEQLNIFKKILSASCDGSLLDKYDDELLTAVLGESQRLILSYTNRNADEWLSVFDGVQVQLALKMFSALGAEGIVSRREGDISTVFEDMKETLSPLLDNYRLVRSY